MLLNSLVTGRTGSAIRILDWFQRKKQLPHDEERAMRVAPPGFLEAPPASGIRVPPREADRNTAVWRAINLIANDMAKIPVRVVRDLSDGTEEPADSDLDSLLRRSPNVEQSAFEFRRMMTSTCCLYGNAFALIQANQRKELLQLIPIDPTQISITVDQATATYVYTHAEIGDLPPSEVIHLRFGPTDSSGILSHSPINRGREALGLAVAQERAGAAAYRNSATPRMQIRHPGSLSDAASARLREQFQRAHAGPDAAGRAILLEEGMTADVLAPLGLESQQWIEARQFSISEVERLYGVPAPLLSNHAASTYSNISELLRAYTDTVLSHWSRIWSSELEFKLLGPDERVDFDLSHVQRGSFATEVSSLNTAVTAGIMTPNEARRRLGLEPLQGMGLDEPRIRLDTTTVTDQDGEGDPIDD